MSVGSGSQIFVRYANSGSGTDDDGSIRNSTPVTSRYRKIFLFMLGTAVLPAAVTVVGVGTATTVVAGPDTEQV